MPPTHFHGFPCDDQMFNGRRLLVARPYTPAPDNPWIWRAEFHDAWPGVDLALLHRGYTYVYADVQNLYGGPPAIAHFDTVYAHATAQLGLARRVVLEGLSRGGLFVYNWAARHPNRVVAIYADNPVCDFKSWPAGRGAGPGSAVDWERLKQVYGFASDADALAYSGNPIDTLAPLAAAGVPLIHVCGDADEVVPYAENTALLADRYRALGGTIEVVLKPGARHHPHGLEDPTPVVDFILRHHRDDRT